MNNNNNISKKRKKRHPVTIDNENNGAVITTAALVLPSVASFLTKINATTTASASASASTSTSENRNGYKIKMRRWTTEEYEKLWDGFSSSGGSTRRWKQISELQFNSNISASLIKKRWNSVPFHKWALSHKNAEPKAILKAVREAETDRIKLEKDRIKSLPKSPPNHNTVTGVTEAEVAAKAKAVFALVMAKARLDEAKKKEKTEPKKIQEAATAAAKEKRAETKKIQEAATAAAKEKRAEMKKIRVREVTKKIRVREVMTTEELDQAAVEANAAPKNYVILKATLQTAELVYNKTGRYVSKDLCISSPKHSININNDSFSNFYFSTKDKSAAPADRIATFPRYDGTVLVMPPKTRGSYKHYTEIGGYMQPYHGAGTGESPSNVIIGSIKALNCEVAHTALIDALKEENFTRGVLMRLLKNWKTGAPNASTLMDYYNSKLNYFAVSFFKGDEENYKHGYVNMGIASNLRMQYDKDLKSIIGLNYNLENRVLVYAPELIPLLDASLHSSGV
jgi:hypothetical protein